jgi:hypothetical protein
MRGLTAFLSANNWLKLSTYVFYYLNTTGLSLTFRLSLQREEHISYNPPDLNAVGQVFLDKLRHIDNTDVDTAILLNRALLSVRLENHRFAPLCGLAGALYEQSKRTASVETFDEAMSLLRDAFAEWQSMAIADTAFSKDINHSLDNVGLIGNSRVVIHSVFALLSEKNQHQDLSHATIRQALYERFIQDNHPQVIHEYNSLCYAMPDTEPGYQLETSRSFTRRALHRVTEFDQTKDVSALDSAISYQRRALQMCSDRGSGRRAVIIGLGDYLHRRGVHLKSVTVIGEAIASYREALGAGSPTSDSADRRLILFKIATALRDNYRFSRDLAHLNEAITKLLIAIRLSTAWYRDITQCLDLLTKLLNEKHKDLEAGLPQADVSQEIEKDFHAGVCTYLNALGHVLLQHFRSSGRTHALDDALLLRRAAVKIAPDNHPIRGACLTNLGVTLQDRFEHTADFTALKEAIRLHRIALEMCPVGHAQRGSALSNLGYALWERFGEYQLDVTLREVIELLREALDLQLEGHPNRGFNLNVLGSALQKHYRQSGDPPVLGEAIDAYRAALKLMSSSDANRGTTLNNLGNALRDQYQQTGNVLLLDEVVAAHRAALALHPEGHVHRHYSLSHLGMALLSRYSELTEDDDLHQAIALQKSALKTLPDGQHHLKIKYKRYLDRAREARPNLRSSYHAARSRGP